MVMEVKNSQDLQLASKKHKKPIVEFQSESKGLRIRKADSIISSMSQHLPMSQPENICRKWILPYPASPSIQIFSELEEAHSQCGWQSALLSLLTQRKQNKINN